MGSFSQSTVAPVQGNLWLPCISPPSRPEDFNRLSLKVTSDRVQFRVNGHLVNDMAAPPCISPFLVLYAPPAGQGVFRHLALTGTLRVPREVRLVHNDELEGWVAGLPHETQPPRLSRLAQDKNVPDGVDETATAEEYDFDGQQAENLDPEAYS